jgi:hypothetical protein
MRIWCIKIVNVLVLHHMPNVILTWYIVYTHIYMNRTQYIIMTIANIFPENQCRFGFAFLKYGRSGGVHANLWRTQPAT